MLSPKYFLYLATGAGLQPRIEMSSNPRVDAFYLNQLGYQEMQILRPPQPIWIVEILLRNLQTNANILFPAKFLKLASSLLQEYLPHLKYTMQRHTIHELRFPEFDPPELEKLFWGRLLLGTEVPELLRVNGIELPWDAEDWLQYQYLQSTLERTAAVSIDILGIPFCRRCGESKAIMEDNCMFCGSRHCLTCTNCQTMGLAKSCIPLYFQSFPPSSTASETLKPPKTPIQPQLDFELTPPQKRAAAAIVDFLASEQRQFLVWAACGAGKTEVSYGAIAKTLSENAKVLFAIPRKDVVVELLPRIQHAFPEIEIVALYGGGGERFQDAPLTLATTHQCLRFYQSFDLVILDEADAYPYDGSAMLHYAVNRALRPGGHMIIMTATPGKSLIQKTRSGTLPYVSIPARYHRKPLIVPQISKLKTRSGTNPISSWAPPALIQQFLLGCHQDSRRALIFLPTLKSIAEYGSALIKWAVARDIPGAIIHSKTAAHEDAKSNLLQNKLCFLVTSTILERGITIPNLDVLVLEADNEKVFDSQTLIQIAGRVGRLGETGRVIFVAEHPSYSMKEALKIIRDMNREGFELGYLDSQE
ncbi:MAG TPA: hypothetical protein DDW65_15500 [Firmicutes bacterium]|nr:hypothetical protein [Bacillota bacterium]